MTRSELPHTVSFHPSLSLEIVLDRFHGEERPLVAGDTLQGHLQLSCTDRPALGEISLELVVEAEAKTSFDRVHEVLYDRSVIYQGADLPLSNAVHPVGGSPGFYPAKRGMTSFPTTLTLPASLPSSCSSPFSSITYTLHAYCHFAAERKGVLHVSKSLDVVQSPSTLRDDYLARRHVEERLRVTSDDGGGSLAVAVVHHRGWISSDHEELAVEVKMVNTTWSWTLPPILRLVKHTTINFPHEPFEVKEIIAQEQYDDRYIVPPHSEQSFTLRMAQPSELRATESSVFSVRYVLCVLVHLAGKSGGDSVEANLPVEILHPSSVATNLWFASATVTVETRQQPIPQVEHRHTARKGWSMPAGVQSISSLLSPLVRQQVTLAESSTSISPAGQAAYAYPQPAFVVHQLSPITEEHETKAERISRHLRETSGNRGRSVSPPPMPPQDPQHSPNSSPQLLITADHHEGLTRPPPRLGFGPRPMPRRSTTSAIPNARSTVTSDGRPAPETTVTVTEAPSVVPPEPPARPEASPDPQGEKSPSPEETVDMTRTNTPIISPSASPVRSRKSVFDLFASDSSPVPASFGKVAMVGPTASARGGRGGQVTSLKEVFKGLTVGQEKVVERPRAAKRMSLPVALESLGSGHGRGSGNTSKFGATNKLVKKGTGRVASMVQVKEGMVRAN